LLSLAYYAPKLPFHNRPTVFGCQFPFGFQEWMESDSNVGPDAKAVLFEVAEIWACGYAIPVRYEYDKVEGFCVGMALVQPTPY